MLPYEKNNNNNQQGFKNVGRENKQVAQMAGYLYPPRS